jgi:hypothetical protein
MKYHSKDVQILLIGLSLFSAAVGLVHGIKFPEKEYSDGIDNLSSQDAISYLSELISSRSVEKIVEALADTSANKTLDIIDTILLDKQSPLNRNDKLELIFALALQKPNNIEAQKKFFDLIIKNRNLYTDGTPVLYVAVTTNYQRVVPKLVEWARSFHPDLLEKMIQEALWYVIKEDLFKALDELHSYGISITPALATELLWYAVDNNNSGMFASLLLQAGAQYDYIYDHKYTFLIRATELNNYDMVTALLKGASTRLKNNDALLAWVNTIPDESIGSALQIAVRNQFGDIDLLLRHYGARE